MKRAPLAAIALLVLAAAGWGQRGRFRGGGGDDEGPAIPLRAGEFHFLRVEYTDLPEFHRGWGFSSRMGTGTGWWLVDWPAADRHFTSGLGRLTRIDPGDPRHMRLTDDRIFDYPWLYATQTGWWDLSPPETARLREYLLRGGFLMVDDFWGGEQWEIFRRTMERVFPGQPIADIAEGESAMHVLYDIREKDRTFIPGSRHLRRTGGGTAEIVQPPGTAPAWRALYDGRGRLVVAVNFNTDMGDAWEFADDPAYPEAMTSLAYKYAVNYVVYAMTH